MVFSALRQMPVFAAAALESQSTGDPPVMVVVLTGLLLVFAILVILYLILLVEGRIFASLDKNKKSKEGGQKRELPGAAAAEIPPAEAPVPPSVEEGIPAEVVAAIAAAVAEASGGQYTLRSVSKAPDSRGRWGLAGVIQNTEPF